mmetsp:Transcript_103985/g.299420  ORF Transcript_103985/g.299420 Transcript_103985/m.299420 type:complete len:280 (+) Transcript_103985:149-988(+)|eukprot:CAMPEP_0119543004 /NCGR_PEP_ID=MMETSP1344-20130328/53894_1 /TAXON_ID=236787 /ORGANISM="Florenciella parvula, Strain CCMP2471" /LENGTH=279 /DNA_ID=CAMNT_0007587277 /DNA_START=141 /DNA_END=980 /DNA_ORIENTATION=-
MAAVETTDYKWQGSTTDCQCCCCCPWKTKYGAELVAEANNPNVRLVSPFSAPASEIIGRAFAGTPTQDAEQSIHWMMGEKYDDLNNPQRQSLIQMFITCGGRLTALSSTGAMLGDYNEQGELRAVLISRRLNGPPSDTCLTCYLCCTGSLVCEMMCCSCCAPDADNMSKRSEAVEKTFKKLHGTHGKGDHIYVNVVAVSPEHQGKGSCSRLVKTVSGVADKSSIPCYLECAGARNAKIYERFGYEVKETCKLEVPNKPDLPSYDELQAMVRPAGGGNAN